MKMGDSMKSSNYVKNCVSTNTVYLLVYCFEEQFCSFGTTVKVIIHECKDKFLECIFFKSKCALPSYGQGLKT